MVTKEEVIAKVDPRFLDGICHRGLHNDKFTENGILAFENAIKYDMAFEYDVHLTIDNEVVICHDSNLERVTGKPGIIEELTLKEIKENYKLKDGSSVPTLKEVIALNNGRVPMVCELKSVHNNGKKVAKYTKEILDSLDRRMIKVISFDPFAIKPFKGYQRELLVSSKRSYMLMFGPLFEGVDLDFKLCKTKRVQRYSKKHFINVYTIETIEDYEMVRPYTSTVTFQHCSKDYIVSRQKEKYNR